MKDSNFQTAAQTEDARKSHRSVIFAAAFLTATSAIGPGFLTQTTQFTAQYLTSLSFCIVMVIILDVIAQLNVSSVIGASGLRAQELFGRLSRSLGIVFVALISIGGLTFNVGNVGGTALGLEAIVGLDQRIGILLGGSLCVCVFLSRTGRKVLDTVAKILGIAIILCMLYMCIVLQPPVEIAVRKLVAPDDMGYLFFPMLTLFGGSCGGYIIYSGAHRLLDAGYGGRQEDVSLFRRSSSISVAVSGTVRILLFLCVLGVCYVGMAPSAERINAIIGADNPAAEAFQIGLGDLGCRIFGVALFAASVTSVIGASYTTVSFLKTLHPVIAKNERWFCIGLIVLSTVLMLAFGNVKGIVIIVGAINAAILPLSLFCTLRVSKNKKLVGENYRHPTVLYVLGWIVAVLAVLILLATVVETFTKIYAS